MYFPNDKDLERLIRKAAERYGLRTSPSDWKNLEQRLEKELFIERKKDKRRLLWLLLLTGLIAGSALTLIVTYSSRSNVAKNRITLAKKSYVNTVDGSKNRKTGKEDAEMADPESLSNETGSEIDKNEIEGDSKTKKSEEINSFKVSGLDANLKQRLSVDQNKKGLRSTRGTRKSNQPGIQPLPSSDQYNLRNENIEQSIKNYSFPNRDNFINSLEQSISDSDNLISKKEDVWTKPEGNESPIAVNKSNQPSKNSYLKKSGFEFGLIAGIDYSKVKSTAANNPGYDIGVLATYRLNLRWSINTGIIFTKKNYDAVGKDYNPPKHYWTNYINLQRLSGYCEMWDIPLNMRYNFEPKKWSQWFGSMGLSTYVMRKQYYEYFYSVNNLPEVRDWTHKSQQNQWLSVLNISGGFEKRLNHSVSIQAEPFAKIPLAGLGFGKMKISTYGVYLILKYKGQ